MVETSTFRWANITTSNGTSVTTETVQVNNFEGTLDSVDAIISSQYMYDMCNDYTPIPYGSSLGIEPREPYEYGVNNFSVRYGYDKKKIDWKWYQPMKDWLKFNLKVLFS